MSDAIMQWEIDRKRFKAMKKHGYDEPIKHRNDILHAALQDVIANYGTLVVVSTADKLTVVQRSTADDLEDNGSDEPAAQDLAISQDGRGEP